MSNSVDTPTPHSVATLTDVVQPATTDWDQWNTHSASAFESLVCQAVEREILARAPQWAAEIARRLAPELLGLASQGPASTPSDT